MRAGLFAIVYLSVLHAAIFGQTPASASETADCPKNLVVTISPTVFKTGDVVTATATFDAQKRQPTFGWTVVGGAIVEGQGTPQAKIRLTGAGDGLVATIVLGAVPPGCSSSASTTVTIDPPPGVVLIDEYEITELRIRKERLDNFVVELQNHLGAMALIAAESKTPNNRATKAFLGKTRSYLVSSRGVDPKSILFAIKKGDADKIQLYLVPTGAQTPLSPDEYVFIKGEDLPKRLAPRPTPKRKK